MPYQPHGGHTFKHKAQRLDLCSKKMTDIDFVSLPETAGAV